MCNPQPIDALTPAFGFHTACILGGGDIADEPSEPVETHLLGLNLTAFDPAGWKSRSVTIYIELDRNSPRREPGVARCAANSLPWATAGRVPRPALRGVRPI